HVHDDVQIARWSAVLTALALAGNAQPRSGVDARWHFDLERLLVFDAAFAAAFATDVFDYPSCTATGRTSSGDREEALLITDLACAAARVAANRLRAFRRA